MTPATLSELNAALLQAVITLGLAALCALLYREYGKRYFLWWAIAWGLYVLRIGAIVGFLRTTHESWLYAHQVLTGWTALALLGAALAFSQQLTWRWPYAALALFPPVWSYVAIYRLHEFLLAAGPAVLFLSLATVWTSLVFFRYQRRVPSRGAKLLSVVLLLWGLHHLDYPVLRARGAWNPLGYYLDILFVLAMGAGIVMLVLEDLHRGLRTLSVLSADLQPAGRAGDMIDALLARPLGLPGVRGSALYLEGPGSGVEGSGRIVQGVGVCAEWRDVPAPAAVAEALANAMRTRRPQVAPRQGESKAASTDEHAYVAVLPILRAAVPLGALVIVGDERDPFTALGEGFLVALGQQVGAALENADLYTRVDARTRELERLSVRMVRQHEEERRRVSLELHDETAQVFSAVKLELGLMRETAPQEEGRRLERIVALVDSGIRSIRSVTNDLRPPLLDDLGLVPALRALVDSFRERAAIEVSFETPPHLRNLSQDAELALFRALQEALANVARHADARRVTVTVTETDGAVVVRVRDDGRGFDGKRERWPSNGHMGLAGMRERLASLGGRLDIRARTGEGVELEMRVPAER